MKKIFRKFACLAIGVVTSNFAYCDWSYDSTERKWKDGDSVLDSKELVKSILNMNQDPIEVINKMIDVQEGISPIRSMRSYNWLERIDNRTLSELRNHLVEQGHFGIILISPETAAKTGSGRYYTFRVETTEPRSYFNPSTELKTLSNAYALTLQEKVKDLFFPGLMSRLGDDEFSRRHKEQYDSIKSRMNVDAQYLVLDVRNGEYVMEEFDINNWSIRIKARPLRPEQTRNGLQPATDGKSYSDTEKKIFIYAEARNGVVKISTIFPGNKWDTIPNGRQNLPLASDKNINGI